MSSFKGLSAILLLSATAIAPISVEAQQRKRSELPSDLIRRSRVQSKQPLSQAIKAKKLRINGYEVSGQALRPMYSQFQARSTQLKRGGVKLETRKAEVLKLPKGLAISTTIKYQIPVGACQGKSASLARAGINCFVNDSGKLSREDLRLRKAIAAEQRAYLKTPEAIREYGSAGVAKLKKMNNSDLVLASFNSGSRVEKESVYLPSSKSVKATKSIRGFASTAAARSSNNAGNVARSSSQLATDYDVLGFTLGKNYKWQRTWTFNDNSCNRKGILCLKVSPFVEYGYGIGLRFPIKKTVKVSRKDSKNAKLTLAYDPFNGNASDYEKAGLPSSKLFAGKEAVAEFGGEAGIEVSGYKCKPGKKVCLNKKNRVAWNWEQDVNFSLDATKYLPGALENGQFTPPKPGGNPVGGQKIFNYDLAQGYLSYKKGGTEAGAFLKPGLKYGLEATKLDYRLYDYSTGKSVRAKAATGNIPVKNNKVRIRLHDPKYNLLFSMTPLIRPELKVKVAGLKLLDKGYTFSLDQLKVSIPNNGIDFKCHSGTSCDNQFTFNLPKVPGGLTSKVK